MLDHFFPLLSPKDSESLKILDILLQEVKAKRPLNGTSKVNRQTDGRTDRRTFRLIESIGQEGQCFEKQCTTEQYSGVQCNTVQNSAVHCSANQCTTFKCSGLKLPHHSLHCCPPALCGSKTVHCHLFCTRLNSSAVCAHQCTQFTVYSILYCTLFSGHCTTYRTLMQFFLHLGLLNCSGVNYVELDYIADY